MTSITRSRHAVPCRPIDFGARNARRLLTELLAAAPALVKHERRQVSDNELREYIGQSLIRTPRPAASRLLRELRDSGLACEQKRFGRIYTQVSTGGYDG